MGEIVGGSMFILFILCSCTIYIYIYIYLFHPIPLRTVVWYEGVCWEYFYLDVKQGEALSHPQKQNDTKALKLTKRTKLTSRVRTQHIVVQANAYKCGNNNK